MTTINLQQTIAVIGLFVTILALTIGATWRMAIMSARIESIESENKRQSRTHKLLFNKIDEIWRFVRKQNGGSPL